MAFPLANYFVQSESNIVHYSKKLYSQNHPAKTSDVYSDIYYSAKQLSSRIPDEDKDSVYCFYKPTLCLALRYLFFRNGGRKCIPNSVVKLIK